MAAVAQNPADGRCACQRRGCAVCRFDAGWLRRGSEV